MDINKDQNKEEMGYITIPVVTYMLEKEMVERRESRLHKIIVGLIAALFLTAILIIGGFLLYLNQYEFTSSTINEFTQTTDSDNSGDANIYDGIHHTETNQK